MQTNTWQPAPAPPNELQRLEVLQSYCVLDTPREPVFDDLTALGAIVFDVPIVLISLVDQHRQFFKSAVGMSETESSRDSSFCGYTILENDILVVLNTKEDERFRDNPFVLGSSDIHFYAGAPLIGKDGMPLGSYCVLDTKPHASFTEKEHACLKRFASLAVDALEKRLYSSQLSEAERAMQIANDRYRLATQATTEGIWDWDCTTDRVFQSARLRSLLGATPTDTDVSLEEWLDRIHPSDLAAALANVRRMRESGVPWLDIEYRIRHEDKTWRWMHNRGMAIRDSRGNLLRAVGALADITSRKCIDPLTGLHTRTSLMNEMELSIAKPGGKRFSLILLDLDGFKRVNASFGRSGGDMLLMECTKRLTMTMSGHAAALLARTAGNEFAIFLIGVSEESEAIGIADNIRLVLQEPYEVRGKAVSLSISMGVAVCPETCERAGNMMHWADVARHESKMQRGGRTVVFSGELHEQVVRRTTLASDLREALTQDALSLVYQPKMDLLTEEIVGFEALARWEHPTLGPISPAEFISVAEECDLILEMGRWTLRTAIGQLAAWRSQNLVKRDVTIAVNLSARQFDDPELIDNVLRKLKMYDLPAACLCMEVTESILITNQEEALHILSRLKSIGVSLDLDDFGTGYSSMSYLHQFPFDSLKIDRSFVMNMTSEKGTTALVRSIVALGQALGLKVIAEGIEDATQLRALRNMGCLSGQGYFISKPLPPEGIVKFMAAQAARDTISLNPMARNETPLVNRDMTSA